MRAKNSAAVVTMLLALVGGAHGQDAPTARARDVMPEIEDALAAAGAAPGAVIELAAPETQLALRANGDAGLSITSFTAATGRFTLSGRGADGRPVYVAGRARKTQTQITAARLIERGSVIGADDLSPNGGSPATLDAFIGKTARRPIAAGAALRLIDVAEAVLVKRGDTVAIEFRSPGIRLSRQGVARMNGVAGDRIDVDVGGAAGFVRATVIGPRLLEASPGSFASARSGA